MKSQNLFEIYIFNDLLSSVDVSVFLCVEASSSLWVSSSIMLHHFLGQGLSLNLDLMDSAKLTDQGSEETFLSLPPRGITGRYRHS